MSKIKKIVKTRDMNIYLTATKEINLGTRTIKSKKVYSRSIKHKNKKFSDYINIKINVYIIAFFLSFISIKDRILTYLI